MSIFSPRSPKGGLPWLKIVLALSLTLNLVVAGVLVGAFLNGERDRPRDPATSGIGGGPYISALPDEARRQLGTELTARAGSLRENRLMLQDQFDRLLTALRAETLDAAEIAGIFEAQDSKLRERQQVGRELLTAQISAMSRDERRAYADTLERRLKRGKKTWPRERGETRH